MSIAPARRASMAEGPALKLRHSIFTSEPIAFSNEPLALPIIGWAWVMFGKAPTRMTVWALSATDTATRTSKMCVLNFICPSDRHCRVPPSAIDWLGSFSGGVSDVAMAKDSLHRRWSYSQGFWQRRRVRREIPGKERGGRRRGRLKCATDRHRQKEPAGRQSNG